MTFGRAVALVMIVTIVGSVLIGWGTYTIGQHSIAVAAVLFFVNGFAIGLLDAHILMSAEPPDAE